MQIALAAGLLGAAQYVAALPASSSAATITSTSSTATIAQRPIFHTTAASPVAAVDTNRTIVDLGVAPAVLRMPVKPNPDFTPNVTNAVAAAQVKYVLVEELMQLERRNDAAQALQKRQRPVFVTSTAVPATTAIGRPVFTTSATASTISTASTFTLGGITLPCSLFPAYCSSIAKASARSTSKIVSASSSSSKVTSSSIAKSTSSTKVSSSTSSSSSSAKTTSSSSSAKTTLSSSSAKTTSTSSSSSSSAKTTSTSAVKLTSSSSTTTTTSTSSAKPTTSSASASSTSSVTPVKAIAPSTTSSTATTKPTSSSTTAPTFSSQKTTSTAISSSSSTTSSKLTFSSSSTTSSKPISSSISSSSSSTRSAVPTLTLAAQNIQLDSEFLSEISIGSNGDTLDVVMDTGSADLWMFSSDCIGCSSSHDFYHPNTSTTFVNTTTPFSLKYGDGSTTSGLVAYDTVSVAGAPIQAQSIDVAHTISASLQSNSMDGILGLGFPSLMSVQGTGISTPFANMIKQNLIPAGMFGLQFIKSNHWSYSGGGGAWIFGGYDKSAVSGALTTVPLTRAQYWMVNLDQVSVGSAYSYKPTQSVIVDSGTTLILLDPSSVANIHSYLPGGRVSPDNSHYQIFCNASSSAYTNSRNAYFTLGGVKYGVPAADLAWYPESSAQDYCYSGIQPWSNSFGILGAMFLKNVYAIFDESNQQMQFAARSDLAALTD